VGNIKLIGQSDRRSQILIFNPQVLFRWAELSGNIGLSRHSDRLKLGVILNSMIGQSDRRSQILIFNPQVLFRWAELSGNIGLSRHSDRLKLGVILN
jgi:hypothetical protein